MATMHKTPGVYISEPDSFPPSIVGVDTAVPAFVGYTARAQDKTKNLAMTPVRISSMAEYSAMFGPAFRESYYLLGRDAAPPPADHRVGLVTLDGGATFYQLMEDGLANFNMHGSLQLFYANGGGECYIVSCGTYLGADGKTPVPVTKTDLEAGLTAVEDVVGPTMLVVPDAVLLRDPNDFNDVAVAMLQQCMKKQDRVAILDVHGVYDIPRVSAEATIDAFRTGLAGAAPEALRYGMAYFPNLQTSVTSATDISISNFDTGDHTAVLKGALTAAVNAAFPTPPGGQQDARAAAILGNFVDKIGTSVNDDTVAAGTIQAGRPPTHKELTQGLLANIPALADLFALVAESQNVLPPSAAMAGIYTQTDATRGVWNAPANVGIANVIAPSTTINDLQQQDMNVPTQGKAINAIRTFPGRGTLVWGARTLDSISNDWRYIQVRRTMIYIEQSVKTALNLYVFAPNTAQTWTTVTAMIESFLHGVWSAGGLMGGNPAEAYRVQCGLGSTMTPDDILNGNMIVQVVLQMVHPAEFIELTFKQQMLGGS